MGEKRLNARGSLGWGRLLRNSGPLRAKRKWLAAFTVTLLALALGFVPGAAAPANAAGAEEFNPGNIIDDALFYDGAAMNAGQVQTFLNQRVGSCLLGSAGYPPGGTRPGGGPQLAQNCLKDFRMSTASRAANPYCASYAGAASETAAQIIAKVSLACGISAKVLVVMLEKEQSLISDTWPYQRQFDVAMGYACPDSGPGGSANCDPTQTGFYQQVYRGAWQLKVYRAFPNDYRYTPGWNSINWQVVERGCGTSQVYIENWATAALYIYTPYRPNSAALAAEWETGDNCSTYGNRNFFNFYTQWFGETHAAPQVLGQLDDVNVAPTGIKVRGWAGDPKSPTTARNVQFYVGNAGFVVPANQSRPDVARAFPNLGGATGYESTLGGSWAGRQEVCAYATRKLGCKTVDFGVHQPTGDVNGVVLSGGRLSVRGWGIDQDVSAPLEVHVYVGGQGYRTSANLPRPDVANAYPQYGPNRGYEWSMPADAWAGTTQQVCVYGINVAPNGVQFGTHPKLKQPCASVTFPAAPVDRAPFGDINDLVVQDDQLTVRGWAIDPDTNDPIGVHVYVGTTAYPLRADLSRPDVAAQGYGDKHGFQLKIPAAQWSGQLLNVCVYGINSAGGDRNPKLKDCSSVQFPLMREDAFRELSTQ